MFAALHVPVVRIDAFTAVLNVIFVAKDLVILVCSTLRSPSSLRLCFSLRLCSSFGFASDSLRIRSSLRLCFPLFRLNTTPHLRLLLLYGTCKFHTSVVKERSVPFRLFAPFYFRFIIVLARNIQRTTIVVRKRNGNLILTATVCYITWQYSELW